MRAPSVEILETRAFLSGLGPVGEGGLGRGLTRVDVIALVAEPIAIRLGGAVDVDPMPSVRGEADGRGDVGLGVELLGVAVDLDMALADAPVGVGVSLGVAADVGLGAGPLDVSLDVAADLDAGLATAPLGVGVSADVGLGAVPLGVSLDAQVGVNLGDGEGDSGGANPGSGANPGGTNPGPGANPGGANSGSSANPGRTDSGSSANPGGGGAGWESTPGEGDAGWGSQPEGVGASSGSDPAGAAPGLGGDARGMGPVPAWIGIDDRDDGFLESQSFQRHDHWRDPAWAEDPFVTLNHPGRPEPHEASGQGSETPEEVELNGAVTPGRDGGLEAPGSARVASPDDLADYPSFPLTVFEALVGRLHRLLEGIGREAAEWFSPANWGFALLSVPLIAAFVANRWARSQGNGDDEEGDGEPIRPWAMGSYRPFPHDLY